jgi:predicted transposase YbfD/YdcC
VSAWVNEGNLVLGQEKTEEKSNEITAIPKLLDAIEIAGDTVTIDAMGCQTDIARKIRKKQADYVLAVKENHKTLYTEIKEYFEYLDERHCTELPEDLWEGELEKDHGRMERRSLRTVRDIGFISGKDAWEDLQTVIQYRSSRTVGDTTTVTDRYYLSSRDASADWFLKVIRGHWSIENNLHWMLDVCFGEDGCRSRTGNLAENLNVLRKIALARIHTVSVMKGKKKLGVRRKMFRASLDEDFLHQILFGKS